jgi:hypothetical protein
MSATQAELWLRLQDEIRNIDDRRNALSKEPESDKNNSDNTYPVQNICPNLPAQVVSRITDALASQPGIDGQKGLRIAMPTAAKVVRYRCRIQYEDHGFKRVKELFNYLVHLGEVVYDGVDNGRQPLISVKVPVRERTSLNGPEPAVIPSTSKNSSNWFNGISHDSLRSLATLAMPEPWDFPSSKTPQYSILSNYLRTTFTRLWSQQKVLVNEALHLASLNTGLLHALSFKPIYALFECDSQPGNRWCLRGFCCADDSTLGKELSSSFHRLPERASYFDKDNSPFFDSRATIQVNFDHLLDAKNLSRLPSSFLGDLFSDNGRLLDLCVKYMTDGRSSSFYENLAQIFKADDDFFKRFRNAISSSIAETQHRIEADFKLAVPMWNPNQPTGLHFLLPLYLNHGSAPDVALIVRRVNSSTYQGLTLLPLDLSYLDARVICRLDDGWLCNLPA